MIQKHIASLLILLRALFSYVRQVFRSALSSKTGRYRLIVGAACVALLLVGLFLVRFASPSSLNTAYSELAGSDGTYATATIQSLAGQDGFGNQLAQARVNEGVDKGRTVSLSLYGSYLNDRSYNMFRPGEDILLYKPTGGGTYSYVDRYRIPGFVDLLLVLLVLVVFIGAWRGITAMIGLALSAFILIVLVVPMILQGTDAFLACTLGAVIVAICSMYIAHGVNRRTTVALIGTLIGLGFTVAITYLSQYVTTLTGFMGDEDTGILYTAHHISLSSVLYGGIVFASLAVLNDITTGQAAAVDELYNANKRQSRLELYKGAMSIGREHIAALINTLAILYIAVTLPSIIETALYNHSSLLVIINSEAVMEELVRTIILSMSLLLAVPITTTIALYFIPYWVKNRRRVLRRLKYYK